METIIASNSKLPEVRYNIESGKIELKGVLIPENPQIFFKLLEDISFKCKDAKQITLHIDLDYFNTSAARYLYNYLKTQLANEKTSIYWYYFADDEDIYESGLEFSQLLKTNFHFTAK